MASEAVKTEQDEASASLAENSSKRKDRSADESVEGVEEEEERPKKMPKWTSDSKLTIQLEKGVFLLVRSKDGIIDLREGHEKFGNSQRGNGVTMHLSEFKILCEKSEELKKAFERNDEDSFLDLGNRMRKARISTNSGRKVKVIKYYHQDGVFHPTAACCTFSVSVLDTLTASLPKVIEACGAEDPPAAKHEKPQEPQKPQKPQKPQNAGMTGASKADNIPDLVVELGPRSRVSVSEWNGSMRVDLRELYEKNGQKFPTKKGISLPVQQWGKLKREVNAVTAAFESSTDFTAGIGPRRSVRVGAFKGKPFIDVREYYGEEGQEKPGRSGMRFNADTWETLKDNIQKIDTVINGNS